MAKGFLIADQSPITGIVETDWAEDTSKSSPSRLQAFLERMIPGLSSNPERDKFWTRIERLPDWWNRNFREPRSNEATSKCYTYY